MQHLLLIACIFSTLVACTQFSTKANIEGATSKKFNSRGVANSSVLVSCESLMDSLETQRPTVNEKETSYGGVKFILTELTSRKYANLESKPALSPHFSRDHQIAKDLDTVWDLKKFQKAREPIKIGSLTNPHLFSAKSDLKILDMPIKMSGSNEYRLPEELAQFLPVIEQILSHEHAMMGEEALLKYYAYITVDQGWVEPGTTQRKPGNHVDGFQGARINPKNTINHSYIVSDDVPTVFYPQAFDFSHLKESVHDFFREMDRLGNETTAVHAEANNIYLMDAYTVHRADLSPKRVYRTFFRVSYDVKEFDRLGNTRNPHFEYDWQMQARDVHETLTEYKPLEQCRACGMCPRGKALLQQNPPQ